MPDSMLYEVCTACHGQGLLRLRDDEQACPVCVPVRVVPVGVTRRQLDRLAERERAAQQGAPPDLSRPLVRHRLPEELGL